MKTCCLLRLILTSLLTISAGTPALAKDIYPAETVQIFTDTCTNLAIPETRSYCGCAVQKFQEEYSLSEALSIYYNVFLDNNQNISTVPPALEKTFISCLPEDLARTVRNQSQNQQIAILPANELSNNARQITVSIDGQGKGSGVLVSREGNNYSVLTNWHVVDQTGEYIVTTHNGQTHSIVNVTHLVGADLALLDFTSSTEYSTATVGNSNQLSQGESLYFAGYPAPLPRANERTFRFYAETLTGFLASADIIDGYELIYTGDALPGLSGSPIFDGNGDLVGVYGEVEIERLTGTRALYGIPISTAEKLAIRAGKTWNTSSNKASSGFSENTMALESSSILDIGPDVIEIVSHSKGDYIEAPLGRVESPSHWQDYDGELISFIATFHGEDTLEHMNFESSYNISSDNLVFLFLSNPQRHPVLFPISVLREYSDFVYEYNPGIMIKLYGEARILRGDISETLYLEVHRIEKLGSSS